MKWFQLLMAGSLLVPAGYFGVSAWESRQRALRAADQQIATTVRLLTEQMDKVLLADRIALSQVDRLVRDMSWDEIRHSERLHVQLEELQAQLPQADTLALIAPDGRLAASGRSFPAPQLGLGSRDYFIELRDRPTRSIFVSRSYTGRIQGRRVFNIAQRRSAAGDKFEGVIVLSTQSAYISDFYQSFAGPKGLSIVLLRDDGAVLARYPPDGPDQLEPSSHLLAAARKAGSGIISFRSDQGRDLLMVGFARVPDSGLLVAYRIPRNDILAPWRDDLIAFGLLTMLGSIAFAMMTSLAMTNAMRVAAAQRHLQTTNATLAQEVVDRARIEEELRALNRELEQRVTARTGTLEELAAQRARETAFLTAVLQAAPYAEMVVDHQGTILMLNSVAEMLFGYDRGELVGRRLEVLLPLPLRRGHAAMREFFMASPTPRTMASGRELHALRKDGTQVPVEIALSPLQTPTGPAVIAGIIDISARRQGETALRQANDDLRAANQELSQANAIIQHKNEEVEAFVHIVSHDLRTPLINLQGFSRELEIGCGDLRRTVHDLGLPGSVPQKLNALIDDGIDGPLHYIRASVVKFERLINALLELSRTGRYSLHSEQLDVAAIVSATVQALGQPIAAARAKIDMQPLPRAIGDPTAVGQIFVNLIENAVKYAHPGRTPHIEIGGAVEDGRVRYWVRDNGIGIPESAHPRLFQVFQRFHPKLADGEGIGLASVRRLVERHGGAVWVDTEPGVGTTFHFILPARLEEEEEAASCC